MHVPAQLPEQHWLLDVHVLPEPVQLANPSWHLPLVQVAPGQHGGLPLPQACIAPVHVLQRPESQYDPAQQSPGRLQLDPAGPQPHLPFAQTSVQHCEGPLHGLLSDEQVPCAQVSPRHAAPLSQQDPPVHPVSPNLVQAGVPPLPPEPLAPPEPDTPPVPAVPPEPDTPPVPDVAPEPPLPDAPPEPDAPDAPPEPDVPPLPDEPDVPPEPEVAPEPPLPDEPEAPPLAAAPPAPPEPFTVVLEEQPSAIDRAIDATKPTLRAPTRIP